MFGHVEKRLYLKINFKIYDITICDDEKQTI